MPVKRKRGRSKGSGKRIALHEISKKLFEADGKNPYYKDGQVIKNFRELRDNIDNFTTKEAEWIARWVLYLGDKTTASKIIKYKGDFKNIIIKRYNQLEKHYNP